MKKTKSKSTPKETKDPSYRRQSGTHGDRAFVELPDPGGTRRIYLGKYGTPESKAAYHQAVGEWQANGRRLRVEPTDLTELITHLMEAREERTLTRRKGPLAKLDLLILDGSATSRPASSRLSSSST